MSDVYGVAQRADEIATSPALLALALAHRRRHEHRRGADSRPAGGARRSGAGAAEGQVPGAVGRREPRCASSLPAMLAAVVDRLPARRRVARGVLRRLRARRSSWRCCWARCCRWRWRGRCGPLLKWLRPVEGALAADSLIQAPRRTSASVAALMLSLALVVAFAGMARASYASIIDWMDTRAQPGSVRHALAGHRRPDAALSARDGGRAEAHARHRRACRRSATRGSCSGRRR